MSQHSSPGVNLRRASARRRDEQIESELAAMDARFGPLTRSLEDIFIQPKKTNVTVGILGLVWVT